MSRPLRLAALVALLAAGPAAAQHWPAPVERLIEGYAQDCAAFEDGVLTLDADAVTPLTLVDPNSGAVEGHAVDTARMGCSSALSLFCGTGGCTLGLVLGDRVTERLTKGWQVVEMGAYRLLLMQVHGSLCGGTNLTPCFEALAWDGAAGALTTLAPRAE